MAVPLAVLATVLERGVELAFNKRTHEAIRGLWARTKWGRDLGKTALVDRKVDEVLAEARQLARNLAPAEVSPAIERCVAKFERDLKDLGLGDDEARTLSSELRRQIDDGIVGPMRELKLLEERLNEVELAATNAEAAVTGMRAEIARLRAGLFIAAACAFLSLFALLVALAVVR